MSVNTARELPFLPGNTFRDITVRNFTQNYRNKQKSVTVIVLLWTGN